MAREAPFAPSSSQTATDFFSARMGCQVEDPVYGIDLAALCVRDGDLTRSQTPRAG